MKMIYLKWGHSIKALSYFASITLNYAELKSLTGSLLLNVPSTECQQDVQEV